MNKNQIFSKLSTLFIFFIFNMASFSAFAVNYSEKPPCQSLNLYVINQSDSAVSFLGASQERVSSPAHSSGEYTITPGNFYTQNCRSIYLVTPDHPQPQLGLINSNHALQKQISVRVNPNGKVESNLVDNFSVEKLIQYEGLGPFLS